MSTDENDWDLEAAEYVLGSLNEQDTKAYDALYKVDTDWQSRVHDWRKRLDPLNASTSAVQPPEAVFDAIIARIEQDASANVSASSADVSAMQNVPDNKPGVTPGSPESARSPGASLDEMDLPSSVRATVKVWKERVRYWQFATVLAVASVVGVLVLAPRYLSQQTPADNAVRTVAVLQVESAGPLWTVSYYPDPKTTATSANQRGFVAITAVGDPQLTAQQSHQLWMVLPEGAGVRSVGLVPDRQGETVTLELPIALSEAGEFAVSLEPLGGVPGPEHGPVVARTFIIREPASLGS